MAVVVTLVACDTALGQVIVVARRIHNCSCCCRGTVMLVSFCCSHICSYCCGPKIAADVVVVVVVLVVVVVVVVTVVVALDVIAVVVDTLAVVDIALMQLF